MGWGHVEQSPGLWTHIRASVGLCSPSADDGGAAQWGRAAHCQLWQPHVAAGLVPIRLERINLCFLRFCGTGGALMSPALQADVLRHLPVHKAFPKSQLAFARFPPPPLPAHSSPNAGVGTSHDMVSNQLLNSYFSWLSLEEAFQSLCLMPPELCSSRCLSSSVLLMGASRRPYTKCCLQRGTRKDAPTAPSDAAKSGSRGGASPPPPAAPGAVLGSWHCCWHSSQCCTVPVPGAVCPSWPGSAAPGALLLLAPSLAPTACQQRVVALSGARGCKHILVLPNPN